MLKNLLSTQAILNRLGMPGVPSPFCILCDSGDPDESIHAFFLCAHNYFLGDFLISGLEKPTQPISPQDLELDVAPATVFLIATVLSQVWTSRKEKKKCQLYLIRAELEARTTLLRKSRYSRMGEILEEIFST